METYWNHGNVLSGLSMDLFSCCLCRKGDEDPERRFPGKGILRSRKTRKDLRRSVSFSENYEYYEYSPVASPIPTMKTNGTEYVLDSEDEPPNPNNDDCYWKSLYHLHVDLRKQRFKEKVGRYSAVEVRRWSSSPDVPSLVKSKAEAFKQEVMSFSKAPELSQSCPSLLMKHQFSEVLYKPLIHSEDASESSASELVCKDESINVPLMYGLPSDTPQQSQENFPAINSRSLSAPEMPLEERAEPCTKKTYYGNRRRRKSCPALFMRDMDSENKKYLQCVVERGRANEPTVLYNTKKRKCWVKPVKVLVNQ